MEFDFSEGIEETKDWTVESLNARLDGLEVGEVLRIEGLPNEVYHGSKGISTSKIKVFLDSPRKYFATYIERSIEFEDKPHFAFGDAGHTTILEPNKFSERYVRQPDSIGTRAGAKWEYFEEQAKTEGKKVLTADQFDAMPLIRKSVDVNPYARRFTTGGVAEVSYFKLDEETGFIIKCRTDYEFQENGKLIISDLKTSNTAEPGPMDKKFKNLNYHVQDAVYTDITGADAFVFVVMESSAPYIVEAPVIMSADLKRLGYLKYRKALKGIKDCMESGVWPSYVGAPYMIKASKFDLDELEKMENENE